MRAQADAKMAHRRLVTSPPYVRALPVCTRTVFRPLKWQRGYDGRLPGDEFRERHGWLDRERRLPRETPLLPYPRMAQHGIRSRDGVLRL